MDNIEVVDTIDLTPTPEGYVNIARFIANATVFHSYEVGYYGGLLSLIETAVYLAINHPDQYKTLHDEFKRLSESFMPPKKSAWEEENE